VRIQAVFNTDQIGGAERSFVATLRSKASSHKIEAWIPNVSNSIELKKYLEETIPGVKTHSFKIGRAYYHVSRNNYFSIIKVLVSFAVSLFYLRKINFRQEDLVWLNGNKVGALFSYYLARRKYEGRVFWHLRDYFPANKFLIKLMNTLEGLKLKFIANSFSVKEHFDYSWPQFNCQVLYNSPATISQVSPREFEGKVGLVAMLTPWKGIHDVLQMAARQEEKLVKLGVRTIEIFGGEIYHTSSTHESYTSELQQLARKFSTIVIKFAGLVRPQEIFTSIDLLIHSSLRPEPFGRVIIEAMEAGVPVVSTGLGGAAELVAADRAWTYLPGHDVMLVKAIEQAWQGDDRATKVLQASQFVSELKDNIKIQLSEIINA
tara:strand:- start:73345 stop:74472 length:1128 start_codon:yes stop_codon:yes gene_type:complete